VSERPEVSIVVPTRDRPSALAMCLAALERQTVPHFEIVVVDDASRDTARVAAVVASAPHARLVPGAGRGPAAARNAGAAAARGAVVCFTDDDCAPVPDWAATLARRLGPRIAAAAGPTRNGRPESVLASAAQAVISHVSEATLDAVTERVRFAPTCNLSCLADVCHRLPFDEDYPLAAGEDRDWCARLIRAGGVIIFEPAAIVHHHQELTLRTFWRQQMRYGRGAYRFHRSQGTMHRPASAGFYAGMVRRGVVEGGVRAGALVCLAQVATAVGMVREHRNVAATS